MVFAAIGVRRDVSEPDPGRRHWKGQAAARDAVYANRRRIRGARGTRWLRQRSERLERPNAHIYETGRMRRVHLRGHPNILKRLLVQVCSVNLGLLMRHLTGVGTPRSLQGCAAARLGPGVLRSAACRGMVRRHINTDTRFSIDNQPLLPRTVRPQFSTLVGLSGMLCSSRMVESDRWNAPLVLSHTNLFWNCSLIRSPSAWACHAAA